MTLTSYISSPNNIKLPNIPRSLPIMLFLGDIFGLFVCLLFAFWLRLDHPINRWDPFIYCFVLLMLVGLYLADTYHPERQIAGLRTPTRTLIGICASGFLMFALMAWVDHTLIKRGVLLSSLGIFSIWAVTLRVLTGRWVRSRTEQSRWLMLGAGESAIKFTQNLLQLNLLGNLFVLTSESNQNATRSELDHLNYVGDFNDLSKWIKESWSAVIIATNIEFSETQVQQLMQIRLRGIPIYRLPDFYETLWYKLPSYLLEDKWFAFSPGFQLMPGYFTMKLKRVVDLILVMVLLVILSPLMLLVILAIKLDSPGPVFYSQLRTGLYGKSFRVYKFRSMYQDAEKRGVQWADKDDPRVTRVGRWLRLLRIDELPQIWNVFKGEMSLIGPRPERPEFDTKLKEAIPYYELRYLVKPGITGWAQVLYPYGASIEDAYEKLAYDLYYIKNYSIWLDLAIAFKTIRVVFLGKGR
jgi:exopolysaccharide biosynthesis polyprenyl glycosylphosphotransferase